jgi:hypothetical protein
MVHIYTNSVWKFLLCVKNYKGCKCEELCKVNVVESILFEITQRNGASLIFYY